MIEQVQRDKSGLKNFVPDEQQAQEIKAAFTNKDLIAVIKHWVSGAIIEWPQDKQIQAKPEENPAPFISIC